MECGTIISAYIHKGRLILMKNLVVLVKPLAWLKLLSAVKIRDGKEKTVLDPETLSSDYDFLYMVRFRINLAPKLYKIHIDSNYVSCIFCRYLKKSRCHSKCFRCSKGTYSKCDCLLPGPSSFTSGIAEHTDGPTWLFRQPCEHFKRLPENGYIQNFEYGSIESVVTNYETAQSLFFGICNGNRPCHICAAVDLQLFLQCPEAGSTENEKKPCSVILKWISSVSVQQRTP
jgi:hypothetical protein